MKTYSSELVRGQTWHHPDIREAWAAVNMRSSGNAFERATVHCKTGSGNDQYLLAYAAACCPGFEELCHMDADALEVVRTVAGFRSEMWCYATAALAWQELPRHTHPYNSPPKESVTRVSRTAAGRSPANEEETS